jgi:hypothetical protein
MSLEINKRDWQGLKNAIKRNPQSVIREAKTLFTRVGSYVDRFLATSPWRIGGANGGVPYATGELFRNARQRTWTPYSLTIATNTQAVPYGVYVHEGTSKMQARPYYESAMAGTKVGQEEAISKFMGAIIKDLAK